MIHPTAGHGIITGAGLVAGPAMARSCHVMPHGGLMESGAPGGGLIRIQPKITFALEPNDSATESILLAKYVDTTFWVSGALNVRRHASTLASGQSFTISVKNTSFAEEDPSNEFVEDGTRASVMIDQNTTETLLVDALTSPIAAQVRVTLSATQAAAASAMSVTIGIDLVGRPA